MSTMAKDVDTSQPPPPVVKLGKLFFIQFSLLYITVGKGCEIILICADWNRVLCDLQFGMSGSWNPTKNKYIGNKKQRK